MEQYTCPMHPKVQRDSPGLCPECGMSLILNRGSEHKRTSKVGKVLHEHDKHAGHTIEMFSRRFWVSLVLTIPIFFGSRFVSLIFGSVVFFYGGWVFVQGAFRELKARLPGMMTLIGLAISVAYFYSVYTTFTGGETLFWELATLVSVMLLGHWMEMKAVSGAQSALKELSKLLPDIAEIIRGGRTEVVPLTELRVNDIAFVRPGAKIPADGLVVEGESEVNESMVTGESKLIAKKTGAEVIAGTINGDGALKVRISKIGENTFLAGVMRLVAQAQASKSRLQILSDQAAFYLTLIAIFSGLATLIVWLFKADSAFALERMVAVLVIACPHALGLAIPLVASISTSLAARSGLLVKQRLALESARNIDVVIFDKTGTLTKGEYGVTEIITDPKAEITKDEILRFAASVDSHSEHLIARAIVKKARELNLGLSDVRSFKRLPGKGVNGEVNGKMVFVGGESMLNSLKIAIPGELKKEADVLSKEGKTINFVMIENRLAGIIALADVIREESKRAVEELKKMGVEIAMITGDSEDVARYVAARLGIDRFFARVLPEEKAEKVESLQKKGQKVAMVGDGINDAPALTQADLGIAIGAGTNVAIESAGIILVKNDPGDIVKIIRLSRATYKKMIQNLFWATGYNIVALPLAAGVLASQNIFLQPALAAIFMSLSTVIVAINALLLKRVDY